MEVSEGYPGLEQADVLACIAYGAGNMEKPGAAQPGSREDP